MICRLFRTDYKKILAVINDAAQAYKGIIPEDRWKYPYMSAHELKKEVDEGVNFYGVKEDDCLLGVMGIQEVRGATLIRHAYVVTNHQRKGIGEKLLYYLLPRAQKTKILVGTWETARWAIRFYEKHGFRLVSKNEKTRLLRKLWNIPERQIETSVVLKLNREKRP